MTIRNHPNRRHALGLCLATLALNLGWRLGWRGVAPPQVYPD